MRRPNLEIVHMYIGTSDVEILYILKYDPYTEQWETRKLDGEHACPETQVNVGKEERSNLLSTDTHGVSDTTEPRVLRIM